MLWSQTFIVKRRFEVREALWPIFGFGHWASGCLMKVLTRVYRFICTSA